MATKNCEYCDEGTCRECGGSGRRGVNRCTYCSEGECNVCDGTGREEVVY